MSKNNIINLISFNQYRQAQALSGSSLASFPNPSFPLKSLTLSLYDLYEFYIIYFKNGRKHYLHFCLDEPVYNSSQYRRKSVFAEAYNPEEDDGDDTKVRVNTMGERDQRG